MSLFDQQVAGPQFSEAEAREIVQEHYGLEVTAIESLGSFQDQNFRVTAPDGRRYVLKIANAATDPATLDLQNQALRYLAARDPAFPTPRLVLTRDGADMFVAEHSGAAHLARLLTFVPGQILAHATRAPAPELLAEIGRLAGTLVRHLSDFSHPAGELPSQWDLQHAPEVIRAFLAYVDGDWLRALIERFLERYQAETAPRLPTLRKSMIHCDITGYNTLVQRRAPGQLSVSGLVDFGDMVRSYLVGELAVAVAETALDDPRDTLGGAAAMVGAFHAVLPLTDDELAVLFDMICLRRCVVAASIAQQLRLDPGNQYVRELSEQDWPVLRKLAAIEPQFARALFRHACGLPPHPASAAIAAWLEPRRGAFAPVVALEGPTIALDLSPRATDLRNGNWEAAADIRAAIEQHLGSASGIGRYGEARLIYAQADSADEPATLHLGADLLVPAGSPVCAPLPGLVEQVGERELILRHEPEQAPRFYSRYAGVCPSVAEGETVVAGRQIASAAEPGAADRLPVHVHVQLSCEPFGWAGGLPGLGRASQRDVWMSMCPDPSPLLGIAAHAGAVLSDGELFERRARVVHQSQEYYYQRPMQIVRGWKQYLYDASGRAYLDAINNVAHVGHGHPHVVEAVARQMALLNTNSRFLYGSMVEYAERLVGLLPDPLRVVFFVCTGSEANDLALRLARAHTRQHDVIVIDGEYHGNTTAVDEISTSLLDNPAAKRTRPWVHPVMRPNTYRGPYGPDDPECGARYAAEVGKAVGAICEQGRGPAAFVAESLLGSSGGIALPAGYLPAAYDTVRAAGGVCVADEVQVGFGRMGTHFWAFETQGVVPDIVTLGKPIGNGHPLSAVITTPTIAEAFRNTTTYFNTYAGNPVSCEAGMAVLDVIEQEGLQRRAREVGAHFKAALSELIDKHALVGAVYGQGMYLGIELVRDRAAKTPATEEAMLVTERMRERGVIVYPTGDDYNILKIKPPLAFDEANADFFAAMLDEVLGAGI